MPPIKNHAFEEYFKIWENVPGILLTSKTELFVFNNLILKEKMIIGFYLLPFSEFIIILQ